MFQPGSECPSTDRAAEKPWQVAISHSVFDFAGVTGTWHNSALQCSGCGMVYSWIDGIKAKRGHLNSKVLGECLRPIHGRARLVHSPVRART